jgi:hypothetical protein
LTIRDCIINRTLVYGLLTVLLGGGYAGVVLGLGQLLGRDSSLVVAMATLALAALFQPARRRIQQAVDRRFDRRRYDTARTIAAFSARLREEVDLDTLSVELLAVVDQTMQPSPSPIATADRHQARRRAWPGSLSCGLLGIRIWMVTGCSLPGQSPEMTLLAKSRCLGVGEYWPARWGGEGRGSSSLRSGVCCVRWVFQRSRWRRRRWPAGCIHGGPMRCGCGTLWARCLGMRTSPRASWRTCTPGSGSPGCRLRCC